MMIGSTSLDTSLTMSASEVRSSASTQIGHQSTSQSEQQSTGTPLKEDYVPQVGDVVEFENGDLEDAETCIGVAFIASSGCMYISARYREVLHGHFSMSMAVNKRYAGRTLSHISGPREAREASNNLQPTFTGSYAERQKQWIEHHGLKVGDKVKVVRKWKAYEGGFEYDYTRLRMDVWLDGVYCIESIDSDSINLDDQYFPYFALEPVAKQEQ